MMMTTTMIGKKGNILVMVMVVVMVMVTAMVMMMLMIGSGSKILEIGPMFDIPSFYSLCSIAQG